MTEAIVVALCAVALAATYAYIWKSEEAQQ